MNKGFLGEFEQLYVYGYSNLGRNAYKKLAGVFQDRVKGILVTQHNKKSEEACKKEGKPIFELAEIKASNDILVIIALNPVRQAGVRQALWDAGFKNIMVYDETMDDRVNSLLGRFPGLELRFLSVSVGQACNLKCRDCANFAPYALRENRRYPLSGIKSDLDKALSCFSEIDTFHIQGGEPFLYSDLGELLSYCRSQFGSILKNIQVATNGTILPDSGLLAILKQGGVVVRISNYPDQENAGRLQDILEKNGVSYRIYDFVNRIGEWSSVGGMDYRAPDDEKLEEKVFHCAWNSCYLIENGLVGRCARSIPARTLQSIQYRGQDYIDLSKNNDMSEIGKYFMFIKPMDCCRHCKASNGEPIPPAIQLDREYGENG